MEVIKKNVEVEVSAGDFFKEIETVLNKTIEKGLKTEEDIKLMKETGFSENEIEELNTNYMMLSKLFSMSFMIELRKYFQSIVEKEVE
jgi:hypothetical protein